MRLSGASAITHHSQTSPLSLQCLRSPLQCLSLDNKTLSGHLCPYTSTQSTQVTRHSEQQRLMFGPKSDNSFAARHAAARIDSELASFCAFRPRRSRSAFKCFEIHLGIAEHKVRRRSGLCSTFNMNMTERMHVGRAKCR